MKKFRLLIVSLFAALAVVCAADNAPRPTATDVRAQYADAVLVDVRTQAEWSTGHLMHAVHLPLDEVTARAAAVLPNRSESIVLFCATGRRAQSAAEQLRQQGYTDVVAMIGGFTDLKAEGFPVIE